jgi:hypothetical protein
MCRASVDPKKPVIPYYLADECAGITQHCTTGGCLVVVRKCDATLSCSIKWFMIQHLFPKLIADKALVLSEKM